VEEALGQLDVRSEERRDRAARSHARAPGQVHHGVGAVERRVSGVRDPDLGAERSQSGRRCGSVRRRVAPA